MRIFIRFDSVYLGSYNGHNKLYAMRHETHGHPKLYDNSCSCVSCSDLQTLCSSDSDDN